MRRPLLLALLLLAGCATVRGEPAVPKVAAQLYTVRDAMAADLPGTLARVRAVGYRRVEFAGLFDHDPRAVRATLRRLGLTPIASHIDWRRFRDEPEAAIDETVALGAPAMVLAWLPPEERRTPADWDRWIATLNRVGALAAARGVRVVYHNHDFEFAAVDGVAPYDRILAGIDRRTVSLELDLYWLTVAGRRPEPYFAAYPDGFPFLHMKDMARDGTGMADVGAGRIDFARILRSTRAAGVRELIVEHDTAADPFGSLDRGRAATEGLAAAARAARSGQGAAPALSPVR